MKGTLDLVGGFIDYGETAENCAIREVKEETGMDIQEKAFIWQKKIKLFVKVAK